MKKYITIAALLVAGTTFANAAEQTISVTTSQTDGVYATSKLSLSQLTTIIETANLNTSLFGIGVHLDNNTDFSGVMAIRTWGDRNEFHVYYNQNAGIDVTNATVNASFSAPSGYTWPDGHAINKAFDLDNATSGALTLAFAPKDAATEVYGMSVILSVADKNGDVTTIVGNATGYAWSNNKYNVTNVFYDDLYISTPTVTVDGSWTHESLVALNEAAAIPEPSAFGLLAGLGVLALVGARRRRK